MEAKEVGLRRSFEGGLDYIYAHKQTDRMQRPVGK